MPDTATALVHIVGIVTLTYELSSDRHLQAIAPYIDSDSRKTIAAIASTGVERHKTVLLFSEKALREGSTWKSSRLRSLEGYAYVELDGHRVEVVDGLEKTRFAIPVTAPSVGGLPRLRTCCPGAKLKPEFQPSTNFRGAAGVLDFPPGNGVPTTCGAVTAAQNDEVVSRRRVDTLVSVRNNGTLSFRAGDRTLLLDGNAEIYFANVPARVLENSGDHAHGGAHYEVYFAMLERDTCLEYLSCHGTAQNGDCDAILRQAARGRGGRNANAKQGRVAAGGGSPQNVVPLDPPIFAFIDYQCSNSQWP